VKKLFAVAAIITCSASVYAQQDKKEERREARKDRIEALRRQEEEGVLVYNKQTVWGIQLRTTGYGAFVELGKMQNREVTNIMQIEFTETKHPKEYKAQRTDGYFFSNTPFVYGKQNYFYNLRFGLGQSRRIGDKGNKNGVSVQGVYLGGLSLGLLRPYYVEVIGDPNNASTTKKIRYGNGNTDDDLLFLNPDVIVGGTGLGKGWGEIKFKPGLHAKTGIRFDYGRFNEVVSSLEVGLAGEVYAQKIAILADKSYDGSPLAKNRQFFFNAYVAIEFGKRK